MNAFEILKRNVLVDYFITYDYDLLKEFGISMKNYDNAPGYWELKLKQVKEAIIKNLVYAGFNEKEIEYQIKYWDSYQKKDSIKRIYENIALRYRLSFGKYLENVVTYIFAKHNINCEIMNGSSLFFIDSSTSDMNNFDLIIYFANRTAIAFDVKNVTKRDQIGDLDKDREWVSNTGMDETKFVQLKKWAKIAEEKFADEGKKISITPAFIQCKTAGDPWEIIDNIVVAMVDPFLINDEDMKDTLIVDMNNPRMAPHPDRGHDNCKKPKALLFDMTPDDKDVISLENYIKYLKVKGEMLNDN